MNRHTLNFPIINNLVPQQQLEVVKFATMWHLQQQFGVVTSARQGNSTLCHLPSRTIYMKSTLADGYFPGLGDRFKFCILCLIGKLVLVRDTKKKFEFTQPR